MGQESLRAETVGWHPIEKLASWVRGKQIRGWLTRTARMALLLILASVALLSTTMLSREYQVFLLKCFLVLFLTILPGWLYLQFIRVKGTGLYDEYVINLYRLRIDDPSTLPKPPPNSPFWPEWQEAMGDASDEQVARNIYLKKFEAAYGRSAVPETRRRMNDDNAHTNASRALDQLKKDAFSPVVWTTIVLTVGWIVVVQPELLQDGLEPLGSISISGTPPAPAEALRFGFIGAYVFILQGLVRRYFQVDLKTHAYVAALARVIVVAALLTTLGPALDSQPRAAVAAFAFLVGIFPELGFRLMKQAASVVGRWVARIPDEERYPVTDLDGVNLWSRARLFEEGIEDMQNFTTANLVDLMLNTRVPINRLVDWIDQSFLYLRVGKTDRDDLRRLGIRTASDLLDSFRARRGEDPEFRRTLLRFLNVKDGEDDGGPSVTEGLRRSLLGEVNLWHLLQWKKHDWLRG
jgi:hypothetical protein